MSNKVMLIGDIAERSGVKIPTIRYYEQVGLLPPVARSEGNRRAYTASSLQRLAFIRHARELGFDLEAIRQLLTLQDNPQTACAKADLIARQHLNEVEWRIKSLRALKRELARMLSGCGSGQVADCRVIDVLADHSKCTSKRH